MICNVRGKGMNGIGNMLLIMGWLIIILWLEDGLDIFIRLLFI